jgi:hypothetical protein
MGCGVAENTKKNEREKNDEQKFFIITGIITVVLDIMHTKKTRPTAQSTRIFFTFQTDRQ